MQKLGEIISALCLIIFYFFIYVFFFASAIYFFYDGILVTYVHTPMIEKLHVIVVSLAISFILAVINYYKHEGN